MDTLGAHISNILDNLIAAGIVYGFSKRKKIKAFFIRLFAALQLFVSVIALAILFKRLPEKAQIVLGVLLLIVIAAVAFNNYQKQKAVKTI